MDTIQYRIPFGLAKRVRAGVALLDEQVPDWAERIDLAKLDLWSSCYCVVGQLFDEDYGTGLDVLLGGSCTKAELHGFEALTVFRPRGELAALERIWRHVIRTRQAVAA